MPGTKWSAFPSVSICNLASELAILHAGVNERITKAQFCVSPLGEAAFWANAAGGFCGLTVAGDISILATTGQSLQLSTVPTVGIGITSAGRIDIISANGTPCVMRNNISSVTISATGQIIINDASGGSATVTYIAAGAGVWVFPLPGDLASAVTRLAAALVVRTGGVLIP